QYIKMTEGEDEKMTHRWQKDADGILIFTGLFSAALAALLTVSVQDLNRIHRIPLCSISQTSINFSPTQTYLVHRSLPLQFNHPTSLLRNQ
ncbi:hypothetical protein BGW80DRAFT_1315808, partial [Lactifluus volemus]